MSERCILAYFQTPEEAQGARTKLQALRAAEVQIERVSYFPGGEGNRSVMNPYAGDFGGLTALTFSGYTPDPDTGVLASADMSASGMADGTRELLEGSVGRDILLTAIVEDTVHDRALQVVRDAGGQV
ncbi:hypothetical protein [Paenibacillus sp. y28]|uniref:hypothetical protein n=1 Tax=Paenibacillus sp. y28 TaxID=3129110 RepID=UPI003015E783